MSIRRQIYCSIRASIESGSLAPGTRLPATRIFAKQHNLSRATVVEAFDELRSDGFITSRPGSGMFVAPLRAVAGAAEPQPNDFAPLQLALSSRGSRIIELQSELVTAPSSGIFRRRAPALDEFPMNAWLRYVRRASRSSSFRTQPDDDWLGFPALRQAIARHLSITRGLRSLPEQVVIVDGTREALDLLAQVLVEPGDTVALEDPGCRSARHAFSAAGATIVDVPVDREGLDAEILRTTAGDAKLLFVTPSSQSPTTVTMTPERRRDVLTSLHSNKTWIVEDDSHGELRYGAVEPSTLYTMDTRARVIYIGTFSTTMWPSIGIGYIIVPADLMPVVDAARRLAVRTARLLDQAALALYIEDGAYARHVLRMRSLYKTRRDALVEAVNSQLSGVLSIDTPDHGLHAVAHLETKFCDRHLVDSANRYGLAVEALSTHAASVRGANGLILGFGDVEPRAIGNGIAALARCVSAEAGGRTPPTSVAQHPGPRRPRFESAANAFP